MLYVTREINGKLMEVGTKKRKFSLCGANLGEGASAGVENVEIREYFCLILRLYESNQRGTGEKLEENKRPGAFGKF